MTSYVGKSKSPGFDFGGSFMCPSGRVPPNPIHFQSSQLADVH